MRTTLTVDDDVLDKAKAALFFFSTRHTSRQSTLNLIYFLKSSIDIMSDY
ncbi:MAG: hypothetical protein Q7U03_09450 [Syntrophales bacterium]|nr:hypothetical protein [Syntrophales bacterium]